MSRPLPLASTWHHSHPLWPATNRTTARLNSRNLLKRPSAIKVKVKEKTAHKGLRFVLCLRYTDRHHTELSKYFTHSETKAKNSPWNLNNYSACCKPDVLLSYQFYIIVRITDPRLKSMETGSRHYQKSVDIRLKPGTASMGEGVRRTLEKDQGTCCFLKTDQTEMAQ